MKDSEAREDLTSNDLSAITNLYGKDLEQGLWEEKRGGRNGAMYSDLFKVSKQSA